MGGFLRLRIDEYEISSLQNEKKVCLSLLVGPFIIKYRNKNFLIYKN